MESVFPATVLKQGEEHQLQGRVLMIRLSDGLLKARVKNSANQIFNVHLDLKQWPEKSARCSCPLQQNCLHAAACLFALQAGQHTAESRTNDALFSTSQSTVATRSLEMNTSQLEWYSQLGDLSHDFFAYQLGILVDNKPVNLVPLIIHLIRRWDAATLEDLSDSLILKLPVDSQLTLTVELGRIKPLVRVLLRYAALQEQGNDFLTLKRHQLLLMLEVEQATKASHARWQGTAKLREKLQQLVHYAIPEAEACLPNGLQTVLRDYQQQGLHWLQCLREYEFGGILADDMGLGKTVQTLAHLLYEKEQQRLSVPSLILAPTSLVRNWYEEARRFTPTLRVFMFHGTERHKDVFEDYDIVISTYGLLQRDKARFLAHQFYYLILDEAHLIKNSYAKTTQLVQQLNAKHRLCLTGTPMENHLGELWSLFHFLMPGFLGEAKQFRQFFKAPIEKFGDEHRREILAKRIQPFVLRRTKNAVAKELPLKTEMTRLVTLTGSQRDLYETIRMMMEKKVREAIAKQGLGKSHILFLDALLKLRQVCCDPRLLSWPEAEMAHGVSAKLVVLMELLDSLLSENRRVLVFSQFTSMLALIETVLKQRQYPYLILTGKTKNRQRLVDLFQQGDIPIFLISLKAGGMGLNLTKADTVIHYDPWWNPAVEEQATDRSHRIGQENPVFVYKLITQGTVEEVILKLQEKKRQLVDGILSPNMKQPLLLQEGDIQQFFMPIPSK